jgi:hypothetical protein
MEFVFDILFTWGLGLLPAFLIRHVIYRKQLKKRYAIPIALFTYFVHVVLTVAMYQAAGSQQTPGSALALVGFVSFVILTSKDNTRVQSGPTTPRQLHVKDSQEK